jgi:hypothetical protein
MADLPYIQQRQEISITGQDSVGDQVNYVSADANGNLAVKDYADGPVTPGTAASVSTLIGGQYNSTLPTLTTGQQSAAQLDTNGILLADVYATAPPTDQTVTGTLTSGSSVVTINLNGAASLNIDVSGPGFVGTIMVQVSEPSSARSLPLFAISSNLYTASITTNGSYRVASLAGSGTVNVMFTSYTSGSANILLRSSTAPYYVQPFNINAGNLLETSYTNDGSGNPIASYNSQLDTVDIINTALSSGSITVGTTAVAARVSTSNLANRKMLMISPVTYTVYMGSSSAVTTATGTPIYPGQVVSFSFSANVTPYLIAATSGTVNIFEAS